MKKEWKGTKKVHPVEYAGTIFINNEPFYEGKNVIDIEAVGEEIAWANAELITDAFNTMNKCGIMPSELLELLKECSDVLGYTVNGHLSLEMDKQQAVYEKISKCTGK